MFVDGTMVVDSDSTCDASSQRVTMTTNDRFPATITSEVLGELSLEFMDGHPHCYSSETPRTLEGGQSCTPFIWLPHPPRPSVHEILLRAEPVWRKFARDWKSIIIASAPFLAYFMDDDPSVDNSLVQQRAERLVTFFTPHRLMICTDFPWRPMSSHRINVRVQSVAPPDLKKHLLGHDVEIELDADLIPNDVDLS
jgi:hypothetical protein